MTFRASFLRRSASSRVIMSYFQNFQTCPPVLIICSLSRLTQALGNGKAPKEILFEARTRFKFALHSVS